MSVEMVHFTAGLTLSVLCWCLGYLCGQRSARLTNVAIARDMQDIIRAEDWRAKQLDTYRAAIDQAQKGEG